MHAVIAKSVGRLFEGMARDKNLSVGFAFKTGPNFPVWKIFLSVIRTVCVHSQLSGKNSVYNTLRETHALKGFKETDLRDRSDRFNGRDRFDTQTDTFGDGRDTMESDRFSKRHV